MNARVIHTRFWCDEYILTLTPREKLLFLYFLSNEYINLSGIYELPEPLISVFTGLTNTEVKTIKMKFQNDGRFAFHHSWVRVMNVEKYQQFKGEKNETAKQREMALAPKELIEYQYPIDRVSGFSDTPSNKYLVISNKKRGEFEGRETTEFNQFWAMYPRKVGKGAAEKAWQKVQVDISVILSAIEKQRHQEQWTKDGGQFIPHPSTWLNQKRWEDEITGINPILEIKR